MNPMHRTATEPVRCPKCSSIDVRFSEQPTFLDVVFRLFGMDAVRCHHCRARFYSRIDDE
jgi:DNA-directed RNA polymerase subunit RPC12/RpoP